MSMHHKLFTLRRRRVVCFVWPSLNIKWPSFLIAAWVTLKHSQEFKNKFLFSRNFTGRSSKSIQPVCRNLKGYRSMQRQPCGNTRKNITLAAMVFKKKNGRFVYFFIFFSLHWCLFLFVYLFLLVVASWQKRAGSERDMTSDAFHISHIVNVVYFNQDIKVKTDML